MNGGYDFWKNRQLRRGLDNLQRRHQRDAAPLPLEPSLSQLTADLLHDVLQDRRAKGERGPGPDGVRLSEISQSEGWAICRYLETMIKAGRFRPSEAREVPLRKPDGGFRTLKIRSLAFGIVAGAVHKILQPKLESLYLPVSYGFRSNRSRWDMLLALEREAVQHNRWFLTQNDIRRAFDNIPLTTAKEAFKQHFQDERLLKLINTLLDGHTGEHREVGIDQGSPISGDALNLFAHINLDVPLERNSQQPSVHRFVDNLANATADEPEGTARMAEVSELLDKHGMQLKHETRAIDIREEPVELLGYLMHYEQGRMRYSATEESWQELEKEAQAWNKHGPGNWAEALAQSWIESHGAIFETCRNDQVDRILQILTKSGYYEISGESLRKLAQSSQDRWERFRDRLMARQGEGDGRWD